MVPRRIRNPRRAILKWVDRKVCTYGDPIEIRKDAGVPRISPGLSNRRIKMMQRAALYQENQ